MNRIGIAAVAALVAQPSFAGVITPIPELDGGVALIALGLTAAVVAVVRERMRNL